jgi:uncharacterized protein
MNFHPQQELALKRHECRAPEPAPDVAKRRLLAVPGEPLSIVQWWRVLFLNFAVDAAALRRELPPAFELELHDGRAIVSLVALTKRNFRSHPQSPLWARLFSVLPEQRLLNVRTYVRHRDEPGAFFFWSWLSRPFGLPLPDRPLGLTCAFAKSEYRHEQESSGLQGMVTAKGKRFSYVGPATPAAQLAVCPAGSLSEFALERYTGYYWHRGGRVFRAWHPAWLQTTVPVRINEDELIAERFPWFGEARFLEANYAPGFSEVWIGRPHPLAKPMQPFASGEAKGCTRGRRNRHGSSALFELP